MRFELTEAYTSPPFQDGALSHSANPPTAFLLYIIIFTKTIYKMYNSRNGGYYVTHS